MTGNAALTEEMTRLLDEHPREARENRFSASLCGEMAVMRLLHNGTKKKNDGGRAEQQAEHDHIARRRRAGQP